MSIVSSERMCQFCRGPIPEDRGKNTVHCSRSCNRAELRFEGKPEAEVEKARKKYREKNGEGSKCLRCGNPHDKRGLYCSKSCGNMQVYYPKNVEDDDIVVFHKTCVNCKFGEDTGNPEYGFDGFICPSGKALNCKPGILLHPRNWEERIG